MGSRHILVTILGTNLKPAWRRQDRAAKAVLSVQGRLDRCTDFTHVGFASQLYFDCSHDLAHVTGAAGTQVRHNRGHGLLHFLRIETLWQIGL